MPSNQEYEFVSAFRSLFEDSVWDEFIVQFNSGVSSSAQNKDSVGSAWGYLNHAKERYWQNPALGYALGLIAHTLIKTPMKLLKDDLDSFFHSLKLFVSTAGVNKSLLGKGIKDMVDEKQLTPLGRKNLHELLAVLDR